MQPIIDTTAAEITEEVMIATTAAQPMIPDVVPTDPTTVSDNLREI